MLLRFPPSPPPLEPQFSAGGLATATGTFADVLHSISRTVPAAVLIRNRLRLVLRREVAAAAPSRHFVASSASAGGVLRLTSNREGWESQHSELVGGGNLMFSGACVVAPNLFVHRPGPLV
jgi:hypothetical protein